MFTLLSIFACLYCMPIFPTLRLTKFSLKNFTTTTRRLVRHGTEYHRQRNQQVAH